MDLCVKVMGYLQTHRQEKTSFRAIRTTVTVAQKKKFELFCMILNDNNCRSCQSLFIGNALYTSLLHIDSQN
uniref:Uncharacterized protein n=1 Tax=Anguilla anguilla TaxID=7936 RepID=A0A0E9SI51_ANGAN